jgi:hypothetical protein
MTKPSSRGLINFGTDTVNASFHKYCFIYDKINLSKKQQQFLRFLAGINGEKRPKLRFRQNAVTKASKAYLHKSKLYAIIAQKEVNSDGQCRPLANGAVKIRAGTEVHYE